VTSFRDDRLSIRKYQGSSLWTNFLENFYWGLRLKSVEKFQISLKSVKNIGALYEDLSNFALLTATLNIL
jgi:hypothetical protein